MEPNDKNNWEHLSELKLNGFSEYLIYLQSSTLTQCS